MAKESSVALQHFIAALENHLQAVQNRRSDDDAGVDRAYEILEDAFFEYEESLQTDFSESLPFE